MQLDLLWQYMQTDMEADKFEAAMRQSPNRQKLLKNRSFLMEQQANMKRIESEIATMSDRWDAIADESRRLQALVTAQEAQFTAEPPADSEEAEKAVAQFQKLVEALTRYEQELAKMKKDTETRDRQQREIRVRAAKAKSEYDTVKAIYDVEYKKDTGTLQELRKKVEVEGKKISPPLLEKYKLIKQHTTPPMAQLMGEQCVGCNMSLPSVRLKEVQAGEKIVECDNCGRILYVPPTGA